MEPIREINDAAFEVRLYGRLNGRDIGEDWFYFPLLQAPEGAGPHASAEHNLAVGDRLGHPGMPVLVGGVEAVRLTGLVIAMRFIGEVRMTQFFTQLLVRDLPSFDCQYQIM